VMSFFLGDKFFEKFFRQILRIFFRKLVSVFTETYFITPFSHPQKSSRVVCTFVY